MLSTDTEIAVATGCLIDINSRSITISTDRNLNNWDRDYKVNSLDTFVKFCNFTQPDFHI